MADTFWQALSDTVHRSVNLRVVTMLGDAGVTGELDRLTVTAPATPSPSLVTDINIVGGDITNVIAEKLHAPEFADLRASHAEAVTQAQAIVERNVNILVTLFKALGDQLHNLPAPSPGPARTDKP